MSDQRPTPETDASLQHIPQSGHYSAAILPMVSVNLARRLERQRDEARELARELREHLQNLVDHGVCNCCHNDEADDDWLSARSAISKAKEVLP